MFRYFRKTITIFSSPVVIVHPRFRSTTTLPDGNCHGSVVLTWGPETLHITLSVSNIQHLSLYSFPPPSVSFHFLISSFVFCFFSLTTKLIESSTIAHSDEEEDRNDTHWRPALAAISLKGLWVTFRHILVLTHPSFSTLSSFCPCLLC